MVVRLVECYFREIFMKLKLKTGDKVVDYGCVHRVFKFENKKNLFGDRVEHVYYRPFFKRENNKTLVCCIPRRNLEMGRIRRPVLKKDMIKVLKQLVDEPKIEVKRLVPEVEKLLGKNKLKKTAEALRLLWLEKKDETRSFSMKKKDLFKRAMRALTEEVAVVSGKGIRKSEKRILAYLNRM